MNHYKHHIADYASATEHLSWDEDLAYTRLIRAYYRDERPLPAEFQRVYRLVRATSEAHMAAVNVVLDEFFTLEPDGWHHRQIDAALAAARRPAEPGEAIAVTAMFMLPLNDGDEYPIGEAQLQEWRELFPGVDVLQALRGMRAWLLANPSKRKTRRGILRFVTAWLGREQDKPNNKGAMDGTRKTPGQILSDGCAGAFGSGGTGPVVPADGGDLGASLAFAVPVNPVTGRHQG